MAWPLADLVLDATQSAFAEDEPATYAHDGGSPATVSVIFDAAFQVAELADGAAFAGVVPKIGVKLADLPGGKALKGDTVTVRGTDYVVHEVQPDGQGGADLLLHEV